MDTQTAYFAALIALVMGLVASWLADLVARQVYKRIQRRRKGMFVHARLVNECKPGCFMINHEEDME